MTTTSDSPTFLDPARALAEALTEQIEELIVSAERDSAPLETDPRRDQLFQLFVQAEAAGFLANGSEIDMSCDAIAKVLADRWKLRDLGGAIAQPTRLPPEQLSRLRVLWSFMRLWMEWSYAWERWHEFHGGSPVVQEPGHVAPAPEM